MNLRTSSSFDDNVVFILSLLSLLFDMIMFSFLLLTGNNSNILHFLSSKSPENLPKWIFHHWKALLSMTRDSPFRQPTQISRAFTSNTQFPRRTTPSEDSIKYFQPDQLRQTPFLSNMADFRTKTASHRDNPLAADAVSAP